MTLHEIFCARDTDKGTFHNYGPDYERFIDPESITTLLEIGVWTGSSLLSWHDWLPNAEIWGVDVLVEPEIIKSFNRIHHVLGSITDQHTIARLPSQLDVIIDDGSHTAWDIVTAIDLLWPRLNKDGWYVIEDIYVNPGLENDLVSRMQPSEHHFISHNSELLFMKK